MLREPKPVLYRSMWILTYSLHHDRLWTHPDSPGTAITVSALVTACTGNTETVVVVSVCCGVPVAVCGTQILWIVVPRTAAQNPLGAGSLSGLRGGSPLGSNQPP